MMTIDHDHLARVWTHQCRILGRSLTLVLTSDLDMVQRGQIRQSHRIIKGPSLVVVELTLDRSCACPVVPVVAVMLVYGLPRG